MDIIYIQLITGFLGTLGFALIFNVGRKHIIQASLCGFFGCGIYLLCVEVLKIDVLFSNVIASAFCALYSELFARILKTPTTVLFIPGIIPLIPGGALYNTMYAAVFEDWALVKQHGMVTLQTALGVAVGYSLVSAILYVLMNLARRKAIKK